MININKFKNLNTQFQKKPERRWTRRRPPGGNTKTELDKPSIVADVIVMNRFNVGIYNSIVMGCTTVNTRAERRMLLNNNRHTTLRPKL